MATPSLEYLDVSIMARVSVVIPFLLAFVMAVFFSLNRPNHRDATYFWIIVFVSFVIFVGLRHEVGGDWSAYLRHYEEAQFFSFWEYLSRMDPGYMLLNWISYQMDGGIYLVNTLSALIFFICLIIFCRAQPLPFLAFAIAVPYMVTVISMGYTRQSVAIGLVLLGLKYLSQGKYKRYLLYVAIGALFHKSAVIMFPLAIFYQQRGVVVRLLGVGAFSLIMSYLFIIDYYEALWINYVESGMQSDGGLIRLLMNFSPSLLFFIYFPRIKKAWPDYRVWLVLSLATFILLPLVMISSTAVDRVALYLIPLQLAVFSRLPMFYSVSGGRNIIIMAIVAFYALVLLVWLNYATHAPYWLPYQNYITLDLF
ncbi:MAG: EpsG family protein [Gammaproteobacteria bacterium]|nr:EpsG family protein [Gammaproteobacteria bacterium]